MVEFKDIKARMNWIIGLFLILLVSIALILMLCTFSSPAPNPLTGYSLYSTQRYGDDKPTINFHMEISKNPFKKTDIQCQMLEKTKEVEILLNCTEFIGALVNKEYQEFAKRFPVTFATNQTKFIVSGHILMNSTMMTSFVTYKITNLMDSKNIIIPPNIQWLLRNGRVVYYSNSRYISYPESRYQNCVWYLDDIWRCRDIEYRRPVIDRLWEKEIFGVKSFNNSRISKIESINELSGEEVKEREFSSFWSLEERKVEVLEFQEARRIMCECHEENKDTKVPSYFTDLLSSEYLAKRCLEEHHIKRAFHKFLIPPSCYGVKIYTF